MSLTQLRDMRRAGSRPAAQIMVVVGSAPRGWDDRATEIVIDREPREMDLRPLVGLVVNVIDLRGDVDLTGRVLSELERARAAVVGLVGPYGETGMNPEHETLLRRYRETLCASC
jgi:non-ribosomal peptide synthetase component F